MIYLLLAKSHGNPNQHHHTQQGAINHLSKHCFDTGVDIANDLVENYNILKNIMKPEVKISCCQAANSCQWGSTLGFAVTEGVEFSS